MTDAAWPSSPYPNNNMKIPICSCGGGKVEVKTSHTQKNPEREFFQCTTCKAFLWCNLWDGGSLLYARHKSYSPYQQNSNLQQNYHVTSPMGHDRRGVPEKTYHAPRVMQNKENQAIDRLANRILQLEQTMNRWMTAEWTRKPIEFPTDVKEMEVTK